MAVLFRFEEERSPLFGIMRRPIAEVYFKRKGQSLWRKVTMLIDTGADYTILPRFIAKELDIDFSIDCQKINTYGVGGSSDVYLLKYKIEVKIGDFTRKIPLGFINNDFVPPLLGRHEFFETFKVIFEKFHTQFEE